MSAEYTVTSGVAVISLNNPPVNALNLATRITLAEGLDKANSDPSISAIVLTGSGQAFCGGADINEFDSPLSMVEPNLLTLVLKIEAMQKPVVAAIHTLCMGGGLELALACHYRLAAPGVSVALPEVKLGLIPGAGGTQRLPRAIGVEAALNMILSGNPVPSEKLAALPGQQLFDKISSSREDMLQEAVDFAASVSVNRGRPPQIRQLRCEHPSGDAYFQYVRNMVAPQAKTFPALLKCVDAVAAATRLPFDAGMQEELRLFTALMSTPESRSLRHMFMAERSASKLPGGSSGASKRQISSVGVIGAGTMGAGIAMNFLSAGIPTMLLERSQEALNRGKDIIRSAYMAQVKKGTLAPVVFEQRLELLTTTLEYDPLKDCDLVIEAVFEDLTVKKEVFSELDRVAKAGAILATNTSTLNVDEIAAFTKRPQDVVGMHFFSPANVMKLIEVVRADQTSKDVLETVIALAKKIKKTAVVAGVCDGFIGNRMIEQYLRQAFFLLDEGATPQQVDKAAERFGFAMGPFRMLDLAGNDIGWAVRKRRAIERPEMKYSEIANKLCELGRFGQKTSAGWYDYLPGKREPLHSKVVSSLLESHRGELGITRRSVSDDEITQRLVYALVNEGAQILDEGIAAKSSDIDVVYVTGYGFPIWRGGPMHYANQIGLYSIVNSMRAFAANPNGDREFWRPAPLIDKLIAAGETFN